METEDKEGSVDRPGSLEIRVLSGILTAQILYFTTLFRKPVGGKASRIAFLELEECTIDE